MASFVLSTAGGAAFGPIGAIIGGIVGGIIDQKLFGGLVDDPEPLENVRFTGGDEGFKLPWGVGTEMRSPGHVIFKGRLASVEVEGEGKGGGKGGISSFEYRVDVATLFMRKEISDLVRVWANGEVIYDRDADVSLAGTDIGATALTIVRIIQGGTFNDNYLDLDSPSGGTNLGLLRSSFDAVVAGFSNSENNGTFRVVSAFINIDGTSGARLRLNTNGTAGVTEAAGASVTITQNLPEFPANMIGTLTIHNGNATQIVDPIIDAFYDDGGTSPFVPAFRGSAYAMFGQLNVTKWGASIPRFHALVEERTPADLGEAIQELVDRTEFLDSTTDVDTTAIDSTPFRGILHLGPVPPIRGIREIMYANYLDVQNQNGVLTFFERKNAVEVAIPAADFAAREADREIPHPIKELTRTDLKLPQELNITFIDPERDYQVGNRTYRRVSNVIDNRLRQALAITMSGLDAKQLAKRRCIATHVNQRTFEFQLPPSHFGLLPADIVTTTINGEPYRIFLTQVDRGANELLRCEGAFEHSAVWTLPETVETLPEGQFTQPLQLPTELLQFVLDMPPIVDEQATMVGLLFATATEDPLASFPGAGVFQSNDGGSTFNQLFGLLVEANTGRTIGSLSGGSNPHHFDRVNTIDVELDDNTKTLQTVPEQGALRGDNDLLIGEEFVGFVTATPVGGFTRRWTISQLIRGRRDTADKIEGHLSNERVLFLGSATRFYELGLGVLGTTSEYRIVAAGQTIASVPSVSITHAGESTTPFTPWANQLRRHPGDALVFSFQRRTRLRKRSFSAFLTPLEEAFEQYEIDVFDPGAPTVVLRTIFVSAPFVDNDDDGTGGGSPPNPLPNGQPFFIYTNAQQVTDFGSVRTDVLFKLYQLGDIVPRGRPLQWNADEFF